jgi:type I restriction enzyme S subunit
MTILELFKKVDPSVLAAKMIFKHLQDNFPVLKISDIADTSSGGTPNRGMIEYYNGNIPWVKSGELKDGIITSCDEYITEEGLKNSSAKLFPKGTLLVAMYGANIGKTGILDFDATTNQAVCAIFPRVDISKDFLFWYFKQQRIEFIAIGKGGAQPNISQTVINNASIVVPDETVQKKIVDFLEAIEQGKGVDKNFFIPEVLEDVERIYKYKNSYVDLSESFENQLTQIDNLNQAILQEAVQGKLVPQNPTDELATELLQRIKAEKEKLGKKEKPLLPIKPEEIPFEIPSNWVWCRLGEICDVLGGFAFDSSRYSKVETQNQVIRLGNVKPNQLVLETSPVYIDDKYSQEVEKSILIENDILITMTGTKAKRDYLFSLCLSANDLSTKKLFLNQRVGCFRFDNFIFPEFINYALKDLNLLSPVFDSSTGAANQANIGMTALKEILIPLPSLSEQKRIVAEIEQQLVKTKQLKAHIIANQQATEQLLKALLHQAFEVGEKEEV